MLVGNLPKSLGLVPLSPTEMMYWLYCPISEPGNMMALVPPNLRQFDPILQKVRNDDPDRWLESYVYLTAKTLWVSGDYIGNRPGWHTDGFGTDDVNYIWYDRAPTEFLNVWPNVEVSDDCDESMREMEALAASLYTDRFGPMRYPNCHLLRLDPTVVHRSPTKFEPGVRTFVKVSLSKDRYDLIGNSINHALALDWTMVERKEERNHPSSSTDRNQRGM